MPSSKPLFYEFTTKKKKYGVPSQNFVQKNVLCEKGDEITRFDGTLQRTNTENWKQIFPEKELKDQSPNFHIHMALSDLYTPTIDLPILHAAVNMCTDPGNI
jgi:hypothetical protein